MRYESMKEFCMANQKSWKQSGEILRQLRWTLEVSQAAVARKIGVSASLISRLENGKPIKRRRMVETSYRTALEVIKLVKQMRLRDLDLRPDS